MTAQPADRMPTKGPYTGPYEVIHLGGQAAVVVPMADFLRLRALEQAPGQSSSGGRLMPSSAATAS